MHQKTDQEIDVHDAHERLPADWVDASPPALRRVGCLHPPPRLPQTGPQKKRGVDRRQHQGNGVQRRLQVQAAPQQRRDPRADQQAKQQGEADLVAPVAAAGPLQEGDADAGAAVDEDGKGDRYNSTENEKNLRIGHGALGTLHAGQVLGAEQVVDAVNEINDGGDGVAGLKTVPDGCGRWLRHGLGSINSKRWGTGVKR